MLKTGLSSNAFKYLSVEQVIKIAIDANLDGIEWDGDIHVPRGDITKAKKVSILTRNAGLDVIGYTSNIIVGIDSQNFDKFRDVLWTAKALKTSVIRVYAGKKKLKYASDDYIKKFILESKIYAEYVKKENMTISFNFEENSLMESNESALSLLERINHNNVFLNWKPSLDMGVKERVDGLKKLLSYIRCVYTFYSQGSIIFPLIDGYNEWIKYIEILKKSENDIYLLITQFDKNESQQLNLDAKVLKDFVKWSQREIVNH